MLLTGEGRYRELPEVASPRTFSKYSDSPDPELVAEPTYQDVLVEAGNLPVGDDDATALAMAVTAAGSCSGGESTHRSRGMNGVLSCGAGVPDRRGMSRGCAEGLVVRGEPRHSEIFPLRRALASQLRICVLFRPVWRCSICFSSSVGKGWLPCANNQFLRMRRDSLENRVPIFGGTADRLTLASVKLSLGVSGLLWVGFVPGVVVAEAEADAEADTE